MVARFVVVLGAAGGGGRNGGCTQGRLSLLIHAARRAVGWRCCLALANVIGAAAAVATVAIVIASIVKSVAASGFSVAL